MLFMKHVRDQIYISILVVGIGGKVKQDNPFSIVGRRGRTFWYVVVSDAVDCSGKCFMGRRDITTRVLHQV